MWSFVVRCGHRGSEIQPDVAYCIFILNIYFLINKWRLFQKELRRGLFIIKILLVLGTSVRLCLKGQNLVSLLSRWLLNSYFNVVSFYLKRQFWRYNQ